MELKIESGELRVESSGRHEAKKRGCRNSATSLQIIFYQFVSVTLRN